MLGHPDQGRAINKPVGSPMPVSRSSADVLCFPGKHLELKCPLEGQPGALGFTKGAGACLGSGSGCEHKALEGMQRHLCHSKCAWELLQGVFGVSQPECHQSPTHCVVNPHTKRSMDGELLPAGFCVCESWELPSLLLSPASPGSVWFEFPCVQDWDAL